MRITTKISWDMLTGSVLEHEFYEYSGPVSLSKGDSTAQAAEVAQAGFDQQLMQIMQKQYGQQQDIFKFMKGILQPEINNPTGYSAAELASMRTGSTDTIAQNYKNAQASLNNAEVQKNGGSDLPSGVNSQLDAALASQEAQAQSGAQEQITNADANLKQQNYWAAINALNGQEAQLNPLGYANAATSGGNTVSNLSGAVTASSGPTFGSILGGIVGAAGAAAPTIGKAFGVV